MITPPNSVLFDPKPSEMTAQEFILHFGELYEHSPWVAEHTWMRGVNSTHDSLEPLADALALTLDQADEDAKLALIRAHPDLAGKAAVSGKLTAASTDEQTSAGIHQCSEEEFIRFQDLNERYKTKFDFPFIKAVKGSNKHAILDAFAQRIEHDRASEFNVALQEINKIAKFRLIAILESQTTTFNK